MFPFELTATLNVSPKFISALTLKKFGLVPSDFNLAQTTVDVLTEQAAAFYDYHAKKLFLTDWTPSATREAALAHELAHALGLNDNANCSTANSIMATATS